VIAKASNTTPTGGAQETGAPIIVIPTFNEEHHIGKCLASLIPQVENGIIVVADGNSTDQTRDIVQRIASQNPKVVLLDNPNKIQSFAINLAVEKHARPNHKTLIRCDAHAMYPDDFIARILHDFQKPDIASVVVSMDATGRTNFAKAAAWIVDSLLGNGGAKHRGGHFTGFVDHGHHAGMDLEWFRRIGGYDNGFSHNEDAEYDLRLSGAGGRIWLNSEIRIDYAMRPTISALTRQYFNYGRGRARTLMKHAHSPRLRQSLPTLNFLALSVLLILSFYSTIFAILPMGYLATLGLISIWGAIRLRDLSGLWAGPAVGAMHNAWAVGYLRQRLFGGTYGR
jgi:succinoglycan biosynthesis protein ExoA